MSDSVADTPFDFIEIERRGRIVIVTYDRGDGLNALSVKGMEALQKTALLLSRDTDSSVIVLQGRGTFSAGADLKDPDRFDREGMSLMERRMAVRLGPDMCQAWADLEQVTIASIEGFCIGGSLALAVACDHRVSSSRATFRLPEVPLGMNMSWRSVPRIVSLIGPSRAKQLIMLGKLVPADQALDWGLVDVLAEPGSAIASALTLAEDYAALPPIGLRMSKQAIDMAAQPLGQATSFMDRDQFLLAAQTDDQTEAISAFLEKRTPDFKGD